MSKSKRLLDILMFINTKKKFSAKELADEFNVSIRTIQRYLLDLSELGLPIYAEKGRQGGYTVLKNRILPPILFTEEEAISIFFACQSLRYCSDLPFNTEIESVLKKFYMCLTDDAKKKADKMDDYVVFWNPKRKLTNPFLRELLEASILNKNVEFLYDSKQGKTIKHVKPIGVYAHNGLWYCPAYSYLRKKILLFRVDRIVSLSVLDIDRKQGITLEEWFERHECNNSVRLRVSLTKEGIRQCKGIPWLEGNVDIIDEETGYINMDTDINEIDYIASYFYSLGKNCRVEEPEFLVDKICDLAKET